ncbi:hypothetical protein FB451DRAFT_1400788 [Mycena latifolia]|nr:hypothetical protein FB451DRAFT_1400788 [Mycena latifolia]
MSDAFTFSLAHYPAKIEREIYMELECACRTSLNFLCTLNLEYSQHQRIPITVLARPNPASDVRQPRVLATMRPMRRTRHFFRLVRTPFLHYSRSPASWSIRDEFIHALCVRPGSPTLRPMLLARMDGHGYALRSVQSLAEVHLIDVDLQLLMRLLDWDRAVCIDVREIWLGGCAYSFEISFIIPLRMRLRIPTPISDTHL